MAAVTGGWASSNRRDELPPDWPQRRQRVLDRDAHQCTWVEAGVRCSARATDVDHAGDRMDHSEASLRSLCDPHHKRKTQAEAAAARAAKSRRRPPPPHPGLVG